MTPLLTWFRVALPALAAPGGLCVPVAPTETLLLDWGHEALAQVLRTHGEQVPGLVEEAVAATSAALTAAVADESPLPALWRAYQALLSWQGFTAAVGTLAEAVFPVDWQPPEPRGGQYAMPPAAHQDLQTTPYGPQPLPEPDLPPATVKAGLKHLRAAFFPAFDSWCGRQGVTPGSDEADALRYQLLDRWYGAETLSGRKKALRRPPARFWRQSSPGLTGSLAWLAQGLDADDGRLDAAISQALAGGDDDAR